MPVDKAAILRTASLARLRMSEAELDSMYETLNKVFQHIDKLNEISVDGVEPLHHVLDLRNVLDRDVPHSCVSREDALHGAPDRTEDYFRLPRVVN
ncbi:Asp-tRNA(Asn)/Glu-tRNA(Gln) amidotransferase subunit GatC [candidate division KSB1 bacterium]|nr:Asp-tRNA(Asn)/Glu-tRNA(Gln) amidotransferase subunit GatC [candidate division KSB1 bacterium]